MRSSEKLLLIFLAINIGTNIFLLSQAYIFRYELIILSSYGRAFSLSQHYWPVR